MILIAVHVNNPQDQPGRIELTFPDQLTCEKVLSTIKYQLKFKSFRVEGSCQKQS
jgi:tRNA(Ile)-lysidine synthase TilS/MesJ